VIPNAAGAPDDLLSRAPDASSTDARSPEDLLTRLEQIGAERYHHRHPFNLLMHAGRLDREDLRLWVANRYYYQTRIPIKDALILAKADDQRFRQVWVQRLLDHDGRRDPRSLSQGTHQDALSSGDQAEPAAGLELWRRLGAAFGLSAEELEARALLLPAAQAACDEYVELVRSSDLVVAVASSLTEHFAGNLLSVRIDAWLQHYPYVSEEALAYFRQRVTRSQSDSQYALGFVRQHARTEEQKETCLRAFEKKCSILWRLLDAVYVACRSGARPRLENKAWLMKVSLAPPSDAASSQHPGILMVPEKALQLNRTAYQLLERCDGSSTLGAIMAELAREHGVAEAAVERDVATFMGELERRRIVVFER
jgi:pyrroloquinoline-quinone synthase